MKYVFISYSSKNQTEADSLREYLNKSDIDTWMAPYDIPGGSAYGKEINIAIKNCAACVLLLSNAAQNSVWVAKEVERVIHYQKVLIPLSIEDVILNDEFEFYISSNQIMRINKIDVDAPVFQHLLSLVCSIIGVNTTDSSGDTTPRHGAVRHQSADEIKEEIETYNKKADEYYDRGDYSEAVKWYRKAAEQGHALAQRTLGYMYYIGKGVPQDYAEAEKWYRKAAEQGDSLAQYNLGWLHDTGKGVPQDDAKAVGWYREAAEQGYALAQTMLGHMYCAGKGVSQDYAEAVKWYRKAAEQGEAIAQCNLGTMYYDGRGVTRNYVEAVRWYRKAAEQGDAPAQCYLGKMYRYGKGAPANQALAVYWYQQAAAQGHEDAKKRLMEMKK